MNTDGSAAARKRLHALNVSKRLTRLRYHIQLTCHHLGHTQIAQNHCSWKNFRQYRSGVVDAVVPRRFQIVASRFAVGCRPSWFRNASYKILTLTLKQLLNVKTKLYNNIK